jgi:hypothetical protein
MAFVHRLGKRVGDAGAYADERRLLDAELRICQEISESTFDRVRLEFTTS